MAKPNILDALRFFAPHSKNKPKGEYGVDESLIASGEPWKYLLGTIYDRCTPSLLERKYKEHYTYRDKQEFMQIGKSKLGYICTECQGIMDAYFTVVEKVKTDINAAMNYSDWCSPKNRGSDMRKMPKLIGLAVYRHNGKRITHVGVVIGFTYWGDPLIFEAKNYDNDVLITEFSKGNWNRWGIMDKRFDYTEAQNVTAKLMQQIGGATPTTPATNYKPAVCAGNGVHIRTGRGTSYSSLGQLNRGEPMQAKKAVDNWCAIKADVNGVPVTGFMYAPYVKFIE